MLLTPNLSPSNASSAICLAILAGWISFTHTIQSHGELHAARDMGSSSCLEQRSEEKLADLSPVIARDTVPVISPLCQPGWKSVRPGTKLRSLTEVTLRHGSVGPATRRPERCCINLTPIVVVYTMFVGVVCSIAFANTQRTFIGSNHLDRG